jgi:hypothetical protein
MSMLEDIWDEERKERGERECPLCRLIKDTEEPLKSTLHAAAAGTLSKEAFVRIMQKHETGVGRRTVERHRQEGHQP